MDSRLMDLRPIDSRPMNSRLMDSRPIDSRLMHSRLMNSRLMDSRLLDLRPSIPSVSLYITVLIDSRCWIRIRSYCLTPRKWWNWSRLGGGWWSVLCRW